MTLAREGDFAYKNRFPESNVKRLLSGSPDFPRHWRDLCARGSEDDEGQVREAAAAIVADVRARGDAALLEHTRRLDRWNPETAADLVLGPDAFARAFRSLSPAGRRALALAAGRIRAFHERETDAEVRSFRDRSGATLAQVVRPLERVGLYVPGGTARYPSSVLMTAIPARVAGVREVVVTSPGVNGTGEMDAWTLAACHVAGVARLYRVGGAQAIAALAHGTGSIAAVDKICGPGNAYVTAAKRLVFGKVDIDMIAGPSEILVLADGTADAAEVASDLIAQAEHDVRAVAVLSPPRRRWPTRSRPRWRRQLGELPRREIAQPLAGGARRRGGGAGAGGGGPAGGRVRARAPGPARRAGRPARAADLAAPGPCSWATPPRRRWATTSPDRATSCPRRGRPASPRRSRWRRSGGA